MAYSAIDNRVIDSEPRPVVIKGGDIGLRDYFAGQALTGLCANDGIEFDEEAEKLHPIYAKHAYKMADAMLAERSKT